jgi:Contractile injection system tube protein
MATSGKLEKMKIQAFTNPDLSDDSLAGEFTAMINPETYALDYKVEFQEGQGQGSSGSQQKFTVKKPEEFSFEFLFDNTGILDGKPRENIHDELTEFRDLLVGYDGNAHEPKHFKLIWGTALFKGRRTALNISYKLFNPDGSPIRAVCKATFKGSVEENLRVAQENALSPDLTHHRKVKLGDTLPWLCYQIYGDSSYYLQIAQINGLTNFRKLNEGAELLFPPIDKGKPAR